MAGLGQARPRLMLLRSCCGTLIVNVVVWRFVILLASANDKGCGALQLPSEMVRKVNECASDGG